MRRLNLGILAHVDAGKTTLTERLLHLAGVVDEVGSVDAGTTRTDSLDLERQRGITIKAAVVSFPLGTGLTVNLIDTPGHPDFIAEVERSLGVLDGAVLVLSAVEGVQAQTKVLFRALQRLRLPTLLFVNKIDRAGAREAPLMRSIRDQLVSSIVPMGTTRRLGTRDASFVPHREIDPAPLADHDGRILAALVDGSPLPRRVVRRTLRSLTRRALVHPLLLGSAMTGAGTDDLARAIDELLPSSPGTADGPLAAAVFKIERGAAGERIAFVRVFDGELEVRARVGDRTVSGIEVFHRGSTERRPRAVAGEIAKVWGLGDVRVGDAIGDVPHRARAGRHQFAPPTLEAIVVADRAGDRVALHSALTQLAEQDPLIGFRRGEAGRDELHLSLYGEVQKEVIGSTLASDFGLSVEFRASRPICIERVVGAGEAAESMPRGRSAKHPFLAGIGLRVEPGPVGSGVVYDDVARMGALPAAFMKAIAETVPEALQQGLHGWAVTDCVVRLTHSAYAPRQSHAHQGFSKAMSSIGSDFRLLTPLVLMDALRQAGTLVCEPVHAYTLEVPGDVVPVMVPLLARLGAPPVEQRARAGGGPGAVLSGTITAAAIHPLQVQLPDLTHGEGVLETQFDSFRPVRGAPPVRPRTDPDALQRDAYLLQVLGTTS